MLKGIRKVLYKISRVTGKIASTITDVTTLLSGDPKRITKRVARKTVSKVSREINKRI